ncbi:MAG: alpha/beta hydrolase [Spirochaetes bacterium]|nr:alpha/beta hydrolase [Spirochaetota bacterium]
MKTKKLNWNGYKIHYEMRKNSSEKTLFFIHGWTASTECWKYQMNSFPDYKVIAVDLPGNGLSSKDENKIYTMELFADSCIEVLREEKIEKAFFLGHSMGFSVAEIISQKYSKKCAGIACIDGAHFELSDKPEEREQWIEYNRYFVKSLEIEKGRDDFINALFLPDTPELLKREIFRISRQVPLSIGRSMIAAAETDMKFWEKRVMDIPCLAVHTEVYHLSPEYKRDFIKMYPRAEYHELKGVSHFFMMEIPYRTNQIIMDYLSKNY